MSKNLITQLILFDIILLKEVNGVKEKNNTKVIILLMAIIIVILAVLCVLFATNTISFNSKEVNDNEITPKNNDDEKGLNEDEAKEILDKLFRNETVRQLTDNPNVTYCGDIDNSKWYTEKELGLDYEWNGLEKCLSFRSYEELIKYFKTFFTEDFYNNKLENKYYSTTEYFFSNGHMMYNFYEKDGVLYRAMSGKGSNVSKSNLLNVKYNIKEALLDKIRANVEATWQASSDDFPWVEKIDIEVVKNNNIWKINKYDVLDD